jgi:predicted molibdopterin-dependent oxidoreductase YjgC
MNGPDRDSAAPKTGAPQIKRLRRADLGTVTITVDGVATSCHAGETIATAILARRSWIAFDGLRRHGLLCGIGLCFECVVAVDGLPGARACMTRVVPGMNVATDSNGAPDASAGVADCVHNSSTGSPDDPRSKQ